MLLRTLRPDSSSSKDSPLYWHITLEHKWCCKALVCLTCISVARTAASALYSNTKQPLECAQNIPWCNNCCRGRIMATQSEGLDYFALGGLVDCLCSSCLSLKMDHQRFVIWPLWRLHSVHKTVALGQVVPPKRHLKLENVILQFIALECEALRLIRRAFLWNTEPLWQSERPPQWKFVLWVHGFAGKFFTVMM